MKHQIWRWFRNKGGEVSLMVFWREWAAFVGPPGWCMPYLDELCEEGHLVFRYYPHTATSHYTAIGDGP